MAKAAEAGPHVSPKTWFCRKLPWAIEIDWFDLTGTHPLDDNRYALVELSEGGTCGTYPGVRVMIVSKTAGQINSKYFLFDDYLSKDLRDREDGCTNYPLSTNTCFHVLAHCGWNWYIAVPRSARPFCEAVERWIDHWRTK